MKPDRALIYHVLDILRRIGPAGLEENALLTEVEIAAGRPLTTDQAQRTVIHCKDRGWAASRRDDFERTIWWLTTAGATTLAGM